MRNVARTVLVSSLNKVLDDDRSRHRTYQRILVLIERVRLECLGDELLDVLLADVLDDGLDGADSERLLPHDLEVLSLLAHVHRERDDIDVLLVHQPPYSDGGVQASGVRKYDLVFGHGVIPFQIGWGLEVAPELVDVVDDLVGVQVAASDHKDRVVARDGTENLVKLSCIHRCRDPLTRACARLDEDQLT